MSEAVPDVDSRFEWPDLLLTIDAVTRVDGRLRLRFHGIVRGIEQREFGESEIADPAARLSRISDTLDIWAAGCSGEQKSIEAHLDGVGVELYEDLIPSALRKHYWSSLHAAPGSTVLVLVEGEAANLPWEIVKPATDEDVAPFWCEQLSMSRWLGSQRVATALPGRRAVCVLADPELHDVSDSARSHLRVPATDVVTDWEALQGLLGCDDVGIFHWTGHGQLNPDHPSLSELPIGEETFRPVDILVPEKRRFLRGGPWVFLHACSTSRSTVGSVGLAGWPKDLVERGAGAMLGAAWDVRTSTAASFVDGLYERMTRGVPVAQAVREARLSARIAGDPSWLAYQLYANPTSRVMQERAHGEFTSVPIRKLVQRNFSVLEKGDSEWRRPYLERLAREPLQPYADVIPLGGSEPSQDLEYSMIYVESDIPEPTVVREFRDIAEAALEHAGVVLVGDSGAGKTATLRRIARDLAARALRGDPDVPTPVLISLDEFDIGDDPLEYLRRRCRDDVVRSRMRRELRAGRICLLCDDLNEIARPQYQKKVRAWSRFTQDWRGNRFVFACRASAYRNELKLPRIAIAPLDDERIMRTLFLAVGASAEELWAALRRGGLIDLARMPLLLEWLIVSFKGSDSRLPGNRSRLLEGIVNSLVERGERTGSFEDAELGHVTTALAELAHTILLDSRNGALPTDDALAVFKDCHPGAEQSVIDAGWRFALNLGFLVERGRHVRFHHLRLRDYFAARALHRRQQQGASMRRYLAPSALDDVGDPNRGQAGVPAESEWAEAVILTSGLAVPADPLLEEMSAVNPRLAGECLARNSPEVTAETVETIRAMLLDRATNADVVLGERLAAGSTLGRIGDPRFRRRTAGFVLPELSSIPAGYVWLGSADDPQAFADEYPQHRVEVLAFGIGRYPVTNAEYNAFVDAGGYADPGWWTERGWAWRRARDTGESSSNRWFRNLGYFRGHIDEMKRWFEDAAVRADERAMWWRLTGMDDGEARSYLKTLGLERVRARDAPAYSRYPALTGANQPVVGVSWYEAAAYCAWLNAVSRRPFRLPTEAEWERAAKGDDRRIYPWGPTWEDGRCNALPENIQRTSPVGVFPSGRSPFGCEDMAGNIAEWTSSRYSRYPTKNNDGRRGAEAEDVPVNRGGGWDSTRRVVRCALRGDMHESHAHGPSLGFRLAVSVEPDGQAG